MPILFIILWITGLVSVALLASGGYVGWLLYNDELEGIQYIFLATVLVGIPLFGKYLVLLLFPSAKFSKDEKRIKKEKITGEDNAMLQVNYFNNAQEKTLLLTHGWGLNSKEWLPLMADLKKMGNVVTWDLPGLGNSSKPATNNYDLSALAKNLKRVLDHMPQKEIILVGHSIGGMTILTFCRLFPKYLGQKVAKIIIVNSTYTKPLNTTIFNSFLQMIETPLIKPLCYITIALSPVVYLMNVVNYQSGLLHMATAILGFTGDQSREELEYATRFNLEANPSVVARGILAMLSFDESKTLATIPIPTQIIGGSGDKVTIPQASHTMDHDIHNSHLVMLKGGHMSLYEKSREMMKMLAAFVLLKPQVQKQ